MFKVKLLPNWNHPPTKMYDGDAGYDVYSCSPSIVLGFGERYKFNLGFSIELPNGWVALIQEKSGMAINLGIMTMGNVIDSNYRGEVHAILCCLSHTPVEIITGQKIAQMVVLPCYTATKYQTVDILSPSNRNQNGFGSTGL